MALHTQHYVEDTSGGSQLAESFRLAPNPNGPKPAHVVRDLGKALATCGLPVDLFLSGDRLHFGVSERGDELVHLPVDVAPGKDFPMYRTLFGAKSIRDDEQNRGVVLGARLVMVLAKVQALAVKAAKTGNAGEALLVMEPNGTGRGPIPFFFTVANEDQGRERWNGIVMPVKYDFAGDRDLLIPAVSHV